MLSLTAQRAACETKNVHPSYWGSVPSLVQKCLPRESRGGTKHRASPPLQKVGGHVPLSTHGSTPMGAFRPKFYGNGVIPCQNVDTVRQVVDRATTLLLDVFRNHKARLLLKQAG